MVFLLHRYQLLTIFLYLTWITTCLKVENIKYSVQTISKLIKNKIVSSAKKRNLFTNPLVAYSDQSIYLSNLYRNTDNSNTSKSIRKTNSKTVIYENYLFISEIVNYKICIRALKKDNLSSGIVASYFPIDDFYPKIFEFESLSAEFVLIGSFRFLTHKLSLIDASQNLYSLVSSIIQFNPINDTFTEISDLSGYRLLPDDRKLTKEGDFAESYPFLINYSYNNSNPASPQIIAVFLSIFQ